MATASEALDVARGEIGYSRYDDPEEGTKYGRWYAELTGSSYYGTSGVPYCAMFVSWCMAQANASAPGIPGAYCPWILSAGKNEGRAVYNEDAQPGDMVLFDWGGDGVADHIGFVEANYPGSSYMQTIEGNTSSSSSGSQSNGGGVYRRTRSYSTIIGVIRPYYGEDDDVSADEVWNFDQNGTLMRDRVQGTDEAANKAREQLTRTDDVSGRGTEANLYERVCWLGSRTAEMSEKLDQILEKLGS